MTNKKTAVSKSEVKLPIEWNMPDGIPTPYATNMLVQIIENEFKLMFFELKPPIRLNASDPIPEQARADYIGGVIVSVDRLSRFIETLQTQLDKYKLDKQGK